MLTFVLVLNSCFCVWRAVRSYRQNELIVVPWALISYFSILLMIQVFSDEYHLEGYTNRITIFDESTYLTVAAFCLLCNLTFGLGLFALERNLRNEKTSINKNTLILDGELRSVLIKIYTILLTIGVAIYFKASYGINYTEFVTNTSSNWGLVLLYAASPLIGIFYLGRNYTAAILTAGVYIYFAISTTIRSFFIFSIFQILVLIYLTAQGGLISKWHSAFNVKSLITIGLLLMPAIMIDSERQIGESIPEQSLVKYMIIVIDKLKNGHAGTSFDSVQNMFYGIIAPIVNLLGITDLNKPDVQEYFAALIFGYTFSTDFMHYPALWYSDAFSSFGWYGALFGLVWAAFFWSVEIIMRRNSVAFILMLPFYMWTVYMIVRGAIGNSIGAISYPLYLTIFIYVCVCIPVMRRIRQ